MERELLKFQRRNRTAGTLLRLSWLIAVAAAFPVLLMIASYFTMICYFLILFFLLILVILTFGAILYTDWATGLVSLDSNLISMKNFIRDVQAAYQTLMPVFLLLTAVFLGLNLFFIVKNGSPRTGRLVSAVLAAAFSAAMAAIYFIRFSGVTA